MGNIGKKTFDQNRKIRALSLLKMFQNRIKQNLFKVEVADWWVGGTQDVVTLRIDVFVEDLDDLS